MIIAGNFEGAEVYVSDQMPCLPGEPYPFSCSLVAAKRYANTHTLCEAYNEVSLRFPRITWYYLNNDGSYITDRPSRTVLLSDLLPAENHIMQQVAEILS